jgi:NADH-quinone oxidoreductase subunit C
VSTRVLERLRERFGEVIEKTHEDFGDATALVARDKLVEILFFLRDDPELQFNLSSTVTGVDYLGQEPRFEVVYHLYSTVKKHRVRVKVRVPEEDPEVDSSVPVWAGNNWHEREVFDLFGIKFKGHPDLRRMFMWKTFEGHALRKDYPKDRRQPLARREGLTSQE